MPQHRRKFFSPLFLVTAGLMLVVSVALHPTLAALIDYYSKEPIELRKSLDDFDELRLGSFTREYGESGLKIVYGDTGTDDLLTRTYSLKDPPNDATELPSVALIITYYSDPRDQIPHTPEVCYRQAGDVVSNLRPITIDVPGLGDGSTRVTALALDVQTRNQPIVVMYFFWSSGRAYNDREKARFAIGWPGDKHTYFSKVEAAARYASQAEYDDAVERCKLMLSEALPILAEDHYPSADDLKRRDN